MLSIFCVYAFNQFHFLKAMNEVLSPPYSPSGGCAGHGSMGIGSSDCAGTSKAPFTNAMLCKIISHIFSGFTAAFPLLVRDRAISIYCCEVWSSPGLCSGPFALLFIFHFSAELFGAMEYISCYADDTRLYVPIKADDKSQIMKLETCLCAVRKWMSENFVLLKSDETEMLVILLIR